MMFSAFSSSENIYMEGRKKTKFVKLYVLPKFDGLCFRVISCFGNTYLKNYIVTMFHLRVVAFQSCSPFCDCCYEAIAIEQVYYTQHFGSYIRVKNVGSGKISRFGYLKTFRDHLATFLKHCNAVFILKHVVLTVMLLFQSVARFFPTTVVSLHWSYCYHFTFICCQWSWVLLLGILFFKAPSSFRVLYFVSKENFYFSPLF